MARKLYKKKLAFTKKINAMKGWTIKNMTEMVQDYVFEMSNIPKNTDDIDALDEVLYEQSPETLLF